MVRTATAALQATLAGSIKNTLTDISVASSSVGGKASAAFASGTAANQIDRAWSSIGRELAAAGVDSIPASNFTGENLGAGDGKDDLGQSAGMVELVAIMVVLKAGSVGLKIDCDVATFQSINLKASPTQDAVLLISCPGDPALSTASAITLEAVGGDAVYDVHLFGRSA